MLGQKRVHIVAEVVSQAAEIIDRAQAVPLEPRIRPMYCLLILSGRLLEPLQPRGLLSGISHWEDATRLGPSSCAPRARLDRRLGAAH